MPPNILIVTPYYLEPPRQKILAVDLAESLARLTRVSVASVQVEGAPALEQSPNLTVHRFRPWLYFRSIPLTFDPFYWYKLWRLIRREKIGAVLVMGVPYFGAFMAIVAKALARVPAIVWELSDPPSFGQPLKDFILRIYERTLSRYTVQHADHVWVQTEHMRQRIYPLGVGDDRMSVMPNGLDTEKFRPGLDTSALRRELGLPEGTPVVLFVAAIHPRKGLRYLLEASEGIIARHPQVQFLIVGDGPEAAEMRARAARIDPTRFIFAGFRRDIPQVLNLTTVNVLPSLREGLPQAILEAYASGVPVVATNVGGVRDILKDGENGFLIPPRDPAAIATAVSALLDDEALRQRIAANNRAAAEQLYVLDKIARDTLEGLERLQQGRKGTAP